jgi:hypothetical protein
MHDAMHCNYKVVSICFRLSEKIEVQVAITTMREVNNFEECNRARLDRNYRVLAILS